MQHTIYHDVTMLAGFKNEPNVYIESDHFFTWIKLQAHGCPLLRCNIPYPVKAYQFAIANNTKIRELYISLDVPMRTTITVTFI